MTPENIRVELHAESAVTALLYRAARRGPSEATLILGHGAGANQRSAFMVRAASGLAARGLTVITFNFPYMERGRRLPDSASTLEACFAGVIASMRYRQDFVAPMVIGGKSLGGRMASHVAATDHPDATPLAGLVFLGYPLHPPGQPTTLRAAHLTRVRAPMLFVQGSRDAFGSPDELRQVLAGLGPRADAKLHTVEGGDHSFTVPKKWAASQDQVYEGVLDVVAAWVSALVPC